MAGNSKEQAQAPWERAPQGWEWAGVLGSLTESIVWRRVGGSMETGPPQVIPQSHEVGGEDWAVIPRGVRLDQSGLRDVFSLHCGG